MNILETTTSNNSAVSLDRYFEPYVAFMSCPHFPDSTDVSRRAVGYECAPVHLLVESDEPCIFRWMQWCHALHPRSATQPSISDTSMNTEGSIGTGGQSLTPCHSLLFVPLNMRSLKSKNQTELLRQLRGQSRCEPSSKHMGNTIDTTPLNLSIWMHSTTRNRTKVVGFRHDELSAECTFCLRVDPTPEQIEQMSSGLLEFHSASKTHFSLPIPEFSDTAKLGEFLQVARSLEVDMSDTVKHFIQTYFLAVRSNGYHMYVLRTLVRTHCDHLKRIVHITKAVARVLLHSECTHIDAAVAIMICEEFHTRKAGAEWSVLGFSESSMLNIDQHFNDLGSDPSQRMTSFCDRLYRIVKNAMM